MIVLDNGDKIRGDAAAVTVVDYTLHGLDGSTLTQLADGQLPSSTGDLYTASAIVVITAIILVNTDSSARAVNLFLLPSGGTARRLIPKNLSLGAGYSLHFDGATVNVVDTSGNLTTVYATHSLGGAAHNADTLANLNTKVSDATLVDTASIVLKALFDANSILKADSDDTPAALTVAEQRLIGRITAGVITALTAAQVRTLINVEDGATKYPDTGENAFLSSDLAHLYAHKNSHDPEDGSDPLDAAAPVQVGEANAEGSSHSLARADHVHAKHHAKYTDAEAVTQALAQKLDDFTAPDDNVDLNASTAKHGLMPKGTGTANNYFKSDNSQGALHAATASLAGAAELAIASEINTGTDAVRAVTPDAFAGSNFGIRYLQMVLFDFTTDVATGNGKFYAHIPPGLNGMNLVYCHAEVITAGTTNTLDIQIHNLTQTADMLSTVLTVDSGETGSDEAATPYVIDTGNDDVATNDVIRVDVDAVHTTPAKGLIVTLGFQLP